MHPGGLGKHRSSCLHTPLQSQAHKGNQVRRASFSAVDKFERMVLEMISSTISGLPIPEKHVLVLIRRFWNISAKWLSSMTILQRINMWKHLRNASMQLSTTISSNPPGCVRVGDSNFFNGLGIWTTKSCDASGAGEEVVAEVATDANDQDQKM